MKTKRQIKVTSPKRTLRQSVKEAEYFIRNINEDNYHDFVSLQLQQFGSMDGYIKQSIHSNY